MPLSRLTLRTLMRSVVTTVVLLSLPIVADAQRPFTAGIGLGASVPVGDLSEGANLGFQLLGTLEFRSKVLPFGVRVDGAWNRFGIDDGDIIKGSMNMLSLTTNVIGTLPSKTPAKVYLLGGLGGYHVRSKIKFALDELDWFEEGDTSFSGSANKFGLNGGAGVNLPLGRYQTFIEARYHHIFVDGDAVKFIPFTFGFRF